jgi:hypothetical protein
MESIGISQIQLTDPMLVHYVNTIKSWDKEGKFQVITNNQIEPLYAIYLEDKFSAASTFQFDSEKSNVNIFMINNDYNYSSEECQDEYTKKLTDIALNKYQADTINVCHVKKLSIAK